MYSKCPKCRSIFHVSEAARAAHHGLVRCGTCQTVFHAIINEVDELSIPGAAAPPSRPIGAARADSGQPDAETVAEDHRRGRTEDLDPGAPRGAADNRVRPSTGTDESRRDAVADTQPGLPSPSLEAPGEVHTQAESESRPGAADSPSLDRPADVQARETVAESPGSGADRTAGEPAASAPNEHEPVASAAPQDAALPGAGREDEIHAFDPAVAEEIVIEAPPVLQGVFGDEDPDQASRRTGTGEAGAELSRGAPADRGAPAGRPAPARSTSRSRDVAMVELPQPRPFKTASLSLLAAFLMLLAVWQTKTFYLDDLAQVPALRPSLEAACGVLGCALPPRIDFGRIDLVGTSIDTNPAMPGALEIRASLLNRAAFPQPYPRLRVTLSDREGRIVGRRTYPASEYRDVDGQDTLPVREVREVSINLAQPSGDAVGYEVELMPPRAAYRTS